MLPCIAALAQPASPQQCRALPDAQARLLCYDTWVDGQAAALKTPGQVDPALAAAAAAAAAPALVPAAVSTAQPAAASFGLEQQARKAEAQEVESEISGLFEGWGPKHVIRLANGQLWQIVDGSSAVLYLKNPKVKVRRGMLGTYVLEFEASNETAKVRRLER
ncbi:hypothetical protein LNV08_08890 [Paucibacter sp. TC2R-5]|uniref:hypothetical protein n=1 Tax=Paucibacter sp. TC2R-5 TaxID=2893555 RepID=UPI0021E37AC3|nr:hypothetical protein [Paucibacter sp. TC2R-5]MCV2359091.1 hypothetical protein [Paucibacter sp. TC2R-5]